METAQLELRRAEDLSSENIENLKLIKLKEVKQITGVSTAFIYTKIKEGDFPAQIQIGGRRVAWLKCEILDWIMQKAINRPNQTN